MACTDKFFVQRLVFLSETFLSSISRLVGYDGESKELDADKLHQYIFGGHVANYMRYLSEEDDERYKKHFAAYIKEGLTADDVRRRRGRELREFFVGYIS